MISQKDAGQLNQVRAKLGAVEFSSALSRYLACDDEFVATQRHSIDLFVKQINRWRSVVNGKGVKSKSKLFVTREGD